ncbi:MAG: GIY-YIG nuclease family protein [Thermoanaerobaculia bacterium]
MRWVPDGSLRQFFVYITSNNSMTLYTGVTNDIVRRVWEQKNEPGDSFTRRYHCTWLVYYESHDEPEPAIRREKLIKGWTRAKKIALVRSRNPTWSDLGEGWLANPEMPPIDARVRIPQRRHPEERSDEGSPDPRLGLAIIVH